MRSIFRITAACIALSFSTISGVLAQKDNAYGNNILSLSPLAVTDAGVGFGLSYERNLDNRGLIALSLPVVYSFRTRDDYYYQSARYTRNEYNIYAYPGVKIYPTGAFGKVRYGVGPSLVIGTGQMYDEQYGNIYPNPSQPEPLPRYARSLRLGTMIHNSLNINPTEKLYLGLELGLGVTYLNRLSNRNTGTEPLVQSCFKIGYRF